MNRLLTRLLWAAAGFAVAALYRQWMSQAAQPHHRHMLETWENEGGALPEPATAGGARPETPGTPGPR